MVPVTAVSRMTKTSVGACGVSARRRVCAAAVALLLIAPTSGARAQAAELSLDEAVARALTCSTRLAALKSSIDVSRRIINEKWRSYLPDVGVSYSKEDTVAYREDDYRSQSILLNVGVDLYNGGRTSAEYRIAKLEALLAAEEYRIERNAIVLNVRSLYYELLKNLDEIAINRKLMESLELQRTIIAEEERLGMATELQRVQVEARIAEAEYGILKSENEYQNRLKDLRVLIGLAPGAALALTRMEIASAPVTAITRGRDELVAIALAKRNEFKKSTYLLYKTGREMELARAYYLPTIRLTGSYGYTGDRYPPNKKMWNVGISVTTAIFGSSLSGAQNYGESNNGGTRSAQRSGQAGLYDNPSYASAIIRTEASHREARLAHDLLRKSIAIEVVRAHDSVRENATRIAVSEKNVALLEKQVAIEDAKARLGEITRYDVLKTYLDLSSARLRRLVAKTDYLIAIAVLERTLGYDIGKLSGAHAQ